MMDFLLALAPLLAMLLASRRLILYYQIASYQFLGFFRTLLRQKKRAFIPHAIVASILTALSLLSFFLTRENPLLNAIIIFLMLLCGFALDKLTYRRMEGKSRLVFTHRMKRYYAVYILMIVLLAYFSRFIYPLTAALTLLAPLFVALAAALAFVPERLIYELYFRDARKQLSARKDIKIIGITGSYGKTSLKFYLQTVLSQKYSVLCTRKSGNTPMGVSYSIRNDLLPSHQVFIAEMGARHRGDIKELTRLVKPDISVLTSVGPQHLETFGSLSAVRETKYDIIRALSKDGYAVFGEDLQDLYDRTQTDKCICGKDSENDYWPEDVASDDTQTYFVFCGKDGTRIPLQTKLKGSHAVRNIVMAAAIAKRMGLSDKQIMHGVALISAVKNRFRIEEDEQGAFIINNGFNSNPVSSRETLYELSKDVYDGRKIIITPGFVELGREAEHFHREFGENLSKVADIVMLVGPKQTKFILEGLRISGFDESSIFVFSTLAKANEYLSKIKQKGDYVLYENDLPESYSEKEGIL